MTDHLSSHITSSNNNHSAILHSYSKIKCPSCNNQNISITNIFLNPPSKSYTITINCQKCNSRNTFDLEKYITFLTANSLPNFNNKCFKHSDVNGLIYCKNCNIYMCHICYSYHSVFEPNHETIWDRNIINNVYPQECIEHCEHNMNFYCENCNVNLCIKCSEINHHNHNVIQLREYWEKVNKGLPFHNISDLTKYLENIETNYDCFIKDQVGNLEYIIKFLQNFKMLVENNHLIKMKNYNLVNQLIKYHYEDFFQCKYSPIFNIIQNVEKIKIGLPIEKQTFKIISKIMDNLSNDITNLAKIHSEIFKSIIISVSNKKVECKTQDKLLNVVICSQNYSHKGGILGKKQQREKNDINTIEDNFSTKDTINENLGNLINNFHYMNYQNMTSQISSNNNNIKCISSLFKKNDNTQHQINNNEQLFTKTKENSNNDDVQTLTNKDSSVTNNNKKKNISGATKKQKPHPKVFTFDPVICSTYLNSLYAREELKKKKNNKKTFSPQNSNNDTSRFFDSPHSHQEISINSNKSKYISEQEHNNSLFQNTNHFKTNDINDNQR